MEIKLEGKEILNLIAEVLKDAKSLGEEYVATDIRQKWSAVARKSAIYNRFTSSEEYSVYVYLDKHENFVIGSGSSYNYMESKHEEPYIFFKSKQYKQVKKLFLKTLSDLKNREALKQEEKNRKAFMDKLHKEVPCLKEMPEKILLGEE